MPITKYRTGISHAITVLFILSGLMMTSFYLYDRWAKAKEREEFIECLDAAKVGKWSWDFASDTLRWDDTMFSIFSKDRKEWTPDYDGFAQCIHVDDRSRIYNTLKKAVETNVKFEAIYRIKLPTGAFYWAYAVGRCYGSSGLKPTRMSGIVVPIDSDGIHTFLLHASADSSGNATFPPQVGGIAIGSE